MMTAGAAALALAACDKPASDEVQDQPETPAGLDDGAAVEAVDADAAIARFEKIAAENLAASAKFLEGIAKEEGVIATSSGLLYKILEEGPKDGISPAQTDIVDVHYVGTLKDGVEFDSSRARGAAARFPLDQVIPGWTEGVQLMSEGDRYRFFVPADLAYGENGSGPVIGPNEALIFDVELLKVQSAEKNAADGAKFLTDNAKKDGVKSTESGLQYEVISEGPADGASPTAADVVKVHYQGTLLNGTEFDSSYARGEPAEFPLARVIPGWTEGVQLMSVGDKFRFFVPSELAYKEGGTPGGPIGPNETLIFEVELLEIKG